VCESLNGNIGCFENYLKMKIIDTVAQTIKPGSTKIEQALEWLIFNDLIENRIHSAGDFELMRYQPFTIINFHSLFASVGRPTIDYPRVDYEV
jgi:hypothetical protein